MLVLSEADLRQLLPPVECIPVMRSALADLARGEVHQPVQRPVLVPPGAAGLIAAMPAYTATRDACLFFDPEKMHTLNHHGEFYDVRGPLNVPRSPQGQPVMVQAGASDDGRDLAAQTAEVVFSAHPNIEHAKSFYSDLKGRVARYGRNPDHLKILPGLSITVGRTHEEALEKLENLDALLHPDVGVSLLSTRMGHDLTGFPIDGPLPELPKNKVIGSRSEDAIAMARSKNMTIRQLYQWFARQRGHAGFVGTPTEVVDQMEQWFTEGACDGFNFLAPMFPVGLNDFVDMVVPELQRRGLYRTAYEGPTLRDILGLPIPQSRYARGSAARSKAVAGA